jgi:hypothetical protein
MKIHARRVAKLIEAKIMAIQIIDTAKAPVKEPPHPTLEMLYSFRRPSEVKEFLKANPFLEPLLVEAYDKISDYFGPRPEVILEIVADPEVDDDRQLVAFIQTNRDPSEVVAKLDQFDKGWWLQASHRSRGKLCIHLE